MRLSVVSELLGIRFLHRVQHPVYLQQPRQNTFVPPVLLQLQHIARKTGQKAVRLPPCLQVLLSDAQSLDQGTISLDVILLQIVQQTTSLTYHL